ncbi:TraR/DksA family transcriptional regulator [Streptomyces sp. NBRC 110028]|uniref:TraR/DksA family transcriptional regulator n=1 Tax=Streptomyces sp. NBRC 110028 TaxID=1621260 RepID=UPI0006E1BAF2|nr:TraR/DksA family transcriptional regulator [Streptomyces sp. NBRC 110028]
MVARKTAVQKSTAKATKAASAKKSASAGKATSAAAQDEKAAKVTKKAAARTTAKKTTKAAVKKATAKKTASAASAKKAVPAKKTGARKVVAKKTPGGAPTAKQTAPSFPPSGVPKARAGGPVDPGELAVRPGEDPWSAEEVDEARTGLLAEAGRLRTEILASEEAITGLMRDSGDGAGDDQADTGTKNITREHEMALAGNAREMLLQSERALERLDAGTYGLCENCGNAIGKARMQAFPRATLCVECKQRQERR